MLVFSVATESTVASKYLGGHSDLLAGVLVVKTLEDVKSVSSNTLARIPSVAQLGNYVLKSFGKTEYTWVA
jgi:O-acetylhomoserine/O-acetylserine sulfhydrylase-like pyridoxal-dependent enzyme